MPEALQLKGFAPEGDGWVRMAQLQLTEGAGNRYEDPRVGR